MRNLASPLIKSLIFILVTTAATVILAISITNSGLGDAEPYRAKFLDATALNVGDDVRISGVRVGQVEKLEIADHKYALVGFSLDRGRRLPSDVQITPKWFPSHSQLRQGRPGNVAQVRRQDQCQAQRGDP